MQRRAFLAAGPTLACALSLPTVAQSYPDRPIKIYQGFAAGGNADTIARVVSAEMARTLGQAFVIEAQTGAGGTIAATTVARAKPDGHTLLLATGGHAVAGALFNKLSYHTVSDFQMISTVTFFPFLFVVRADSPYMSFGELLAASRSAGQVFYGTAGLGSTHHLAGELLAAQAKAGMRHVPYRGDAASVTALLAGEVAVIIAPPTAVMANIQAGKLRALATTSAQRASVMPALPTVSELAVPGYEVTSWAGFMAPAGTPRPVVDRLREAIDQSLRTPVVRSRLSDMGGEVRSSTPEEMSAMVASELRKWTSVVDNARIPKQ